MAIKNAGQAGKLNPLAIKAQLYAMYDIVYFGREEALFDANRPLAKFSLCHKEGSYDDSLMQRKIDEFIDMEIYKHTGIDLDKFLALPSAIARGICNKINTNQARVDYVKKAINDFKNGNSSQALSDADMDRILQQSKAIIVRDSKKKEGA